MDTVTVEFPTIELPPNHYWLIVPMADYWSVEIIETDGDTTFHIVATSSDVDFNKAVSKCLDALDWNDSEPRWPDGMGLGW